VRYQRGFSLDTSMELTAYIRSLLDEMEFEYDDEELTALVNDTQWAIDRRCQEVFDNLREFLLDAMEEKTDEDEAFKELMGEE
jgi:hypothetical protein